MHIGERERARKLLEKTLRETPRWQGLAPGFATAGAFTDLAEILIEFGEHDHANKLLSRADAAGRAERHQGFRRGAIDAASSSSAATGGTASAIEAARKTRSEKSRRKKLVPLLAKTANWKELRDVLNDVGTAKEATQLALAVKYALPDGIWT